MSIDVLTTSSADGGLLIFEDVYDLYKCEQIISRQFQYSKDYQKLDER